MTEPGAANTVEYLTVKETTRLLDIKLQTPLCAYVSRGLIRSAIHNLHYYLNLMREVRAALDAGSFSTFVKQFHADRARGV